LQTKAARSQQELTGQALDELRQAQATAQQGNQQAQDDALRPFLKTLLDVHDGFTLAEREIRRTQETILPHLDELAFASEISATLLTEEPETGPQPKAAWWQRLFGKGRSEKDTGVSETRTEKLQEQQRLDEQQEKIGRLIEHLDQLLDSIITGYSMSLQRLERGLEHSGLEPIACVGQPFDPELMEVVAAVADTGRSSGEVIEEVRRGYLWHGRVFRYAQVSVAKS
jgi:molecular chaperone GrpE